MRLHYIIKNEGTGAVFSDSIMLSKEESKATHLSSGITAKQPDSQGPTPPGWEGQLSGWGDTTKSSWWESETHCGASGGEGELADGTVYISRAASDPT